MARIRTIKPEFWSDEKLAECDPVTRLVFLGLIGMADDCGRLLDNAKVIDAFVFPSTSDTCREAVANLSRMCRIRRGTTASGQKVIQIANWTRHQKVDKPNLLAALPEVVDFIDVAEIRESVANQSRDVRECVSTLPTTNDQRPTNNERKENGACAPKEKNRFVKPTLQEVEAYCDERDNAVPAQQFLDHYESVGWKVGKGGGKPMRDWKAAIRSVWEPNHPKPSSRVPTAEDDARWNAVDGGLGP
jgi:hypothetical protein